jgi:hypothetical protein
MPSIWCGTLLAFLFLLSPYLADADVLKPVGSTRSERVSARPFSRGSSNVTRADRAGDPSIDRTPAGDLTAADELLWDGENFRSYRYERLPAGETARVERYGEELFYEQHVNGVTRRNRERFDERVTVGPTVIPWAQRHWKELAAGRELTVRYAVRDQLRTFEFRLATAHDHPRADRETVVKIWPASFMLRLFVSPVYLIFTWDGHAFRGMIGRLLPVTVQHGKVRPIDGELALDAAASDSGGGRR